MNDFDSKKEIKKANMYVGFWKEATDILFLSSLAMATICVGACVAKAFHLEKGRFPLTSLALTNFIASVSMFFMAGMSNIMKNEAISNRDRLLKEAEKKILWKIT